MFGINVSGGEFGGSGTRYDIDYHYPTFSELSYYAAQGVQLIRLPIKWERMEPSLGGPLSTVELAHINSVLSSAHALGMEVILDVHNYGRYGGATIGSAAVPTESFAKFWGLMATALNGASGLAGYDLMNEPHDMGGAGIWQGAAQAAINAIRAVDTQTAIYAEGDGWASAGSWAKTNGNFLLNDPAGKLIYEAHVYFDKSNQGIYTNSYDADGTTPNIGADRVQVFANWLAANHVAGFIGEFGAPSSDPRWLTVVDNAVRAMEANGIGGTAWGGGFWWGNTYNLRLGGGKVGDSAEFNLLKPYFHAASNVRTAGDDHLVGTALADRISAGDGDDVIAGSTGADTIVGGLGIDTIDYGLSTAAVTADLGRTAQRGGYADGDMLGSIENVRGSEFGDQLHGNALANLLIGNGGDDILFGDAGADQLVGGAGNDTADYSMSAVGIDVDLIRASQIGGDANGDTLLSIERVVGSGFADRLSGGGGADQLVGGAGNDTMEGRGGADLLDGGDGRDLASYAGSGAGVDVDLTRNVQLGGDAAGDQLSRIEDVAGSSFNDRLAGDGLANWLSGGAGDDVLIGGRGTDKLSGGAGNDRFQYGSVADAKGDRITDFSLGDLIDLGGIDANSALAGNQAFRSIGSHSFDGAAGELRYFQDAAHSLTYVQGDANGDKIADFTISLDGLHALTVNSFVM